MLVQVRDPYDARDAIAIQNHLTLQAVLRADPAAVQAYNAVKLTLTAEFPEGIDGHYHGKTELITGLSAKAVSRISKENLRLFVHDCLLMRF